MNTNDYDDFSSVELQAISEDDAETSDSFQMDRMYPTPELSGGSHIAAEAMDAYFNEWFGDEAEEFKAQTQDIFARAVFARTNALAEELEEFEGITLELAQRVCELERELVFLEATDKMITTDRERFRAMSEHIEYEGEPEEYRRKLLTEKRRLFPYATGSSDPLNEEQSFQPAQPANRLIAASMDAITKFTY